MPMLKPIGKAARLSAKIAKMQQQLATLINETKLSLKHASKKRQGPSIASLTVKVLKGSRRPLKINEIYERVVKLGAVFQTDSPKVSLYSSLTRMENVEKVGVATFQLVKTAK